MQNTTTPAARPVALTVTVPEGVVVRKYEQTASRDHDVTLVAGTYDLKADRSPEGFLRGYWASIPAVAHAHTASTVEFGGVALAWEERGGETEVYGWHAYAYEIERIAERGTYSFTYAD